MIRVNFFGTLKALLKTKQIRIYVDEIRIVDLLKLCETKTPESFLHKFFDKDGNIISGTIILVNGQNILQLHGVNTMVRNGADVVLFPANEKE